MSGQNKTYSKQYLYNIYHFFLLIVPVSSVQDLHARCQDREQQEISEDPFTEESHVRSVYLRPL